MIFGNLIDELILLNFQKYDIFSFSKKLKQILQYPILFCLKIRSSDIKSSTYPLHLKRNTSVKSCLYQCSPNKHFYILGTVLQITIFFHDFFWHTALDNGDDIPRYLCRINRTACILFLELSTYLAIKKKVRF
jgi:hypothetical protein